jgi:hypothetical protein
VEDVPLMWGDRLVEGDGACIGFVRLYEDDVRSASAADIPERVDQRRGEAVTAVPLGQGEVVKINLAALLLELLQLVRGESTDDIPVAHSGDGDERLVTQRSTQTVVAGQVAA